MLFEQIKLLIRTVFIEHVRKVHKDVPLDKVEYKVEVIKDEMEKALNVREALKGAKKDPAHSRFQCEICSNRFKSKQHLKAHIVRLHQINWVLDEHGRMNASLLPESL